jgi:hypothetical protein
VHVPNSDPILAHVYRGLTKTLLLRYYHVVGVSKLLLNHK